MTMKNRWRALVLAMTCAVFFAPSLAMARPAVPAKLTDQDRTDLQRIERYLNDIRTLSSPFLQVASNGKQARGQLALARPGKIRIDYGEPNGLLLVGGSGSMVVYDRQLKQANNVGIDQTPLGLLVRDQIRLSGDVTVTRFERQANVIRVTLSKTSDADVGRVTLVFDERPLQLKQWTILDGQGVETKVSLLDPQQGMALDPKLFEFTAPDIRGARGRQ
jgi:outer membrane lipoprotein-sorting protein